MIQHSTGGSAAVGARRWAADATQVLQAPAANILTKEYKVIDCGQRVASL